jgi:hypothetical protein
LTHPFQLPENDQQQHLGTIPEETKEEDVEMDNEDQSVDTLILHYTKTIKELEDQDCYEQRQMELEIDALRHPDELSIAFDAMAEYEKQFTYQP